MHKKIFILLTLVCSMLLAACQPVGTDLEGTLESPTDEGGLVGQAETIEEFISALQATGADVQVVGEVNPELFNAAGQAITVDGAQVQVFEFPDEASRQAASDTISQSGQVGDTVMEWIAKPNFWANGRIIVLYVGDDPALVGTMTGVMGLPVTDNSAAGGGFLPPEAALEAQRTLSEQMGVGVEEIEIVSSEQIDWPNACLGLEEAGEACADVITPGFRIVLSFAGQTYEFRTDRTGGIIRQAQSQ